MSMRAAPGRRLDWLDTRIEAHFSNFLFIDRSYRSHPVLRRILSLARLHGYQSLLIEELSESTCPLLVEENAALRLRRSDYTGSITHRLSFWRCLPDAPSTPQDFIGYAIFKSDRFSADPFPHDHLYEAVATTPSNSPSSSTPKRPTSSDPSSKKTPAASTKPPSRSRHNSPRTFPVLCTSA